MMKTGKLLALTIFLLFLFLLTSCKNTDTPDPDELDPSVEIGTKIYVEYSSDSKAGGKVEGELSQTIDYGKTTTKKVTAVANVGYVFSHWSDGETSPTREKESPSKSQKIVAYFEIDKKELPIICINTENSVDITSKDMYINGNISVLNTDEKYLIDNLEIQIRGRGNYTWSSTFNGDPMYNKRPYRIKLSEQKKLCGVGEGKSNDWALLADHCDQSLLRNNIVYTFASKMPNIPWQSHVQSVELYLNGAYNGVYLLCEQVEVNQNKINVSEDLSQPEIGFLVMYSNYTNLWDFGSFQIDGYKYETKSKFSDDTNLAYMQFEYIQNRVYECWQAIQSGDEQRVKELIDLDSLIESYFIQEVFKNLDTGHDNFYMSMDIGGKLKIGPVWDFDQCAGNADEGVDEPTGIRAGITQPWYSTLLNHKWFRKLVAKKWDELKSVFDTIPSVIKETAEKGYNSYCRNFDKWKIFGYKINRETYVRQFTTYKEHYEYFASFMEERIEWLDSYIHDPTFALDYSASFDGSGTKSDPYIISSAEDFYSFTMALLSGESFADCYFLQTANIDMNKIAAYGGAGSSALFAGVYNGNGHSINAYINGYDECIFPYVSGKVMNLITKGGINNVTNAGGIARSVRSGGVIFNCISYMNLSAGDNLGGIASSNQAGAEIVNCFFGGEITYASYASPICAWYNGRTGVYLSNYYIAGTRDDVSYTDFYKEETPLSGTEISSNLAGLMNDFLQGATSVVDNIDESELCRWNYNSATGEMELMPV